MSKPERAGPLKRLWLWTVLLGSLHLSSTPTADAAPGSSECSRCAIYILDIASFAPTEGYPVCDPEKNVVVDPGSGVVYRTEKDTGIRQKASHKYGTHSAPWYLMQAIKNSECYVDDMAKANIIYVYDYCYYIWWLATVHSALGVEVFETPGDYLVKGWDAMTRLPRWQQSGGRDFVFYDSHPGFGVGDCAYKFVTMLCQDFKLSNHLLVETAQRNTCKNYLEMKKILLTPYVPNAVDLKHPLAVFDKPSTPKEKRDIFVYFRGRCTPSAENYVGKIMRHALVKALGDKGSDLDISCSEPELGGTHESFPIAFDKMQRTVFCLVPPGDAQSTRRLSELFMSGCIPVFLGPPFNTMPFGEDIPYASIGVFFNFTDYSTWLKKPMVWEVHPTERAFHPQDAWFWRPDADIADVAISVSSFESVLGHLRGMPEGEISRKLGEMNVMRRILSFEESMSEPRNALNVIIKRLCNQARHHPIRTVRRSPKPTKKPFVLPTK